MVDRLAQTQPDAHVAEAELERLGEFVVNELEQPRARLDERDVNPHGRQHAGVFRADHPAADDDHALGQLGEVDQFIGVDDGVGRERHVRRARRRGADGDEDVVGLHLMRVRAVDDAKGVRVDE